MSRIADLVKYESPTIRVEKIKQTTENGVVIVDVLLKAGDFSIPAFIVIPEGDGPFPGVHFIHWLETHANDSNRTQFLPMAIEMAQDGIMSIMADCFWSLDKDKFKENPLVYTSKWWKTDVEYDLRLIKRQLTELKIVEDHFLSLDNLDQSRVGLGGHDFGAMFGCLLSHLGFEYNVYGFMAMTSHFSDWFRFGSKLSEEELQPYIEALEFIAPIEGITNLNSSPIHFGFAKDDFYVPLLVAERIVEAAKVPTQVRYYDAEHGMNNQAFTDLKNWLKSHLVE